MVAMRGKVVLRDGRKNARKATGRIARLAGVAAVTQDARGLGAGDSGHLFGADDKGNPGAAGFDRIARGIQGRRARRAGILQPCGGLPAQGVVALQGQRRGKHIGREAAVEVAQPHAIHHRAVNARVLQGLAARAGDEVFQAHAVQPAKRQMRPTHHRCTHVHPPLMCATTARWQHCRQATAVRTVAELPKGKPEALAPCGARAINPPHAVALKPHCLDCT